MKVSDIISILTAVAGLASAISEPALEAVFPGHGSYIAGVLALSGIVATASGLLITVDLDGKFLAFDAATGKLVRQFSTGQSTGGGVITYQAGGKQRIAMVTGLEDNILAVHGKPAVLIFGL